MFLLLNCVCFGCNRKTIQRITQLCAELPMVQEYTVSNLTVENQGGKVVRVRLPARMLTRGNYQIELRGVAADGSKSPSEVYSFTVSE